MSVNDARISIGLPSHPKTKRLIRKLGEGAGWYLLRLILWTASDRPNGYLGGMSDDDIELAIDWNGEEGAFVTALGDVGFLDGEEFDRRMHDWADHNPYAAGAPERKEQAKWGALVKHYGRQGASERMPEYAKRLAQAAGEDADRKGEDADRKGEDADGNGEDAGGTPKSAGSMLTAGNSNAPSPSPSPSPSPPPSQEDQGHPQPPDGGDSAGAEPSSVARRRARTVVPYEDIVAAYRLQLPQLSQPATLSRKRKKAMDKAWALLPERHRLPAVFRAIFAECNEDPFLNGTGPYGGDHAGWEPNFDYLIREDVVAKVYEKAMHRRAQRQANGQGNPPMEQAA